MKGYRCDTCHDFAPHRMIDRGDGPLNFRKEVPPETWLKVAAADGDLHFCSPGCVAAWAQTQAAEMPV